MLRPRRETVIEDAVINNADQLGFPDSLAIRNCRLAMPTGRVDVVLLPPSGPVKLVLVEAKVSSASDAASKVVGQLLMYYGGALNLGTRGLTLMRKFADQHRERALAITPITPKMLTGGVSPPDRAFGVLHQGERLTPKQIRLFIALDGDSHRGLGPTLGPLQRHHGLDIGLVIVRKGKIERVVNQHE